MKKIISAILVVSIIATCGFAAFAATIGNPNKDVVYVHDQNGNHSPIEVTSGKVIAQHLEIDKPFTSVQVCCPSYSDNVGGLIMTLYKWAGDYDSTIGSTPIAKKEWVDFKDNGWLTVDSPEGQAYDAGEYMWTLTEPTQKVGVWKAAFDNLDTDIIQTSYVNGEEVEGCLECCVLYAGEGVTIADGSAPSTNPANPSEPAKVVPKDSENIIMYVDSNTAYVKGTETTLDVPATVIGGRTLLPVRFVAESLGAVVNYYEDTQTVIIEKDDLVVSLVLGVAEIRVSGESQAIDVPAMTINDRTVVPVRAIAEALGQQVNYFEDGDKGLIVIGEEAEGFAQNMANAFIELYK